MLPLCCCQHERSLVEVAVWSLDAKSEVSCSTAIELTVFNLCFYALGFDLVAAKMTGASVALINAYFGNRQWAFRDRARHVRTLEISLFIGVNAACLGLGAVIVSAGESVFGTDNPLIVNFVNLVSIAIVVVVRFAFYHWVVFRTTRPDGAS